MLQEQFRFVWINKIKHKISLQLQWIDFYYINDIFFIFLYLQQLKATIRELDKIKDQIIDSDIAAFQSKIEPTKNKALNDIQEFGKLHDIITKKIQESIHQEPGIFNLLSELKL